MMERGSIGPTMAKGVQSVVSSLTELCNDYV